MVDPQASRFWQVGLQSGLIDAASLQACFEAIAPEKRVAEHIDRRLARQAIQQRRLSLWQAQQVLAGRSSGFKINRYTIIDMIGQGGMGRVYLARDTRLNRRVALKVLSPERMNNPRAIARFQREARVGAQLQHENLVRIYDEGEAGGKCYLVMEYIEGKNIGAILAEDGPIPPATAARLTRQVALGLEHAQQKGLIHRDVNPYNILVTRDGVAKLTDLGLAIDQAEEAQVTREGATVGTFDYISPEQARHSHSVDTRSDIYSLGCTLFHMLTGQVPFPSPSLPEKLYGHQGVDPVAPTSLVPGIPEGLSAIVLKMMRKSPDERYATPWDVAQALERFEEGPGTSTLAGQASSGSRNTGRSSLTDTRVVATPRIAAVPHGDSTQAATQVYESPVATATSSPSGSASASGPTPVPPPAGVVEPPPPASSGAIAASGSDEVWADLGLAIDLGPEPSLTEGLSQSRKKRSRSSAEDAGSTPSAAEIRTSPIPPSGAVPEAGTNGLAVDLRPPPTLSGSRQMGPKGTASGSSKSRPPGRGSRPRWLIGAGAVAAVAAVLGLTFGPGLGGRARPDGTKRRLSARPIVATRTIPASAVAGRKETPEVTDEPPIAVKMPDGTLVAEATLKGAMQRAIGGKGHVLLNNREPLRLTGPDASINISGGRLSIRAAVGTRPVLEVEIKGQKPFLSTRTDTPLTIAGVSIVARYVGNKMKVVPALIEAGGNVALDRCAFTAKGDVRGTRAIAAEGGGLTVVGCWFEGFDTAIDVAAFSGLKTTIQQSMLVRGATDDRPFGWAVRFRRTAGGSTNGGAGRQLSLEHCTVKGAGLLHLVDFSPQSPMRVDIEGCAVLANAVLAWGEDAKSDAPPIWDALAWKGKGNQYDIRGTSWIVLSPAGTPGLPGGPTDLTSWRANMTETAPLRPPIRFRTPPESLSDSPKPGDFGISDQDARTAGADPDQVGPGASTGRPSS